MQLLFRNILVDEHYFSVYYFPSSSVLSSDSTS